MVGPNVICCGNVSCILPQTASKAKTQRRKSVPSSKGTLRRSRGALQAKVREKDDVLSHERDCGHERDARRTNNESAYSCPASVDLAGQRSEERRVGKECRSRWS